MPTTVDLKLVAERVLHVLFLVGSAYVASQPKYAWLVPVLTGAAQFTPSPR